MKPMTLGLETVNLGDERFRTSYFFPLEPMVESIRKVGLIAPPVVCLRESSHILVTGWKRVLACRELSLSPVPVLRLEGKTDLDAFRLAFFENLAAREFGLEEKAEVVGRFEELGEDVQRVIRHCLPLLNLPSDRAVHSLLLTLSKTGEGVKRFVRAKNPPLSVVRPLLGLPQEEQTLLVPLLQPIGQNKQREILEDLEEIEARDGTRLEELIGSAGIREDLDSASLPPLQKSERLRKFLREKRHPFYSSCKESFDRARLGLDWPAEAGLEHSPYFEEDFLSVKFSFRDRKEFLARLKRLEALADKKDFDALFAFRPPGPGGG